MKTTYYRRILRSRLFWIAALFVLCIGLLLPKVAYHYVRRQAVDFVREPGQLHANSIAIVPGANIYSNGKPSRVLRMRIDRAVGLYKAKRVCKLLMSGDNRFTHYNEPDVMRQYAVQCGVPLADIICDYAGRRTYDTVYRAKHIFRVTNGVLVTQDRYMGRTLYLARAVGLDAVGVTADTQAGLPGMNREYLACVNAIMDVKLLHPKPVMGRVEPIIVTPHR